MYNVDCRGRASLWEAGRARKLDTSDGMLSDSEITRAVFRWFKGSLPALQDDHVATYTGREVASNQDQLTTSMLHNVQCRL